MTRVAMLLSNPFRPDVRVLKEAASLALNGYQTTILCWDRQVEFPQRQFIEPGIEIIRIQSVKSGYGLGMRQLAPLLGFWRAAWRRLEELKPDVVHCHDFDTLPAGMSWARRRRIPLIYDAHEYYADIIRPRLNGFPGVLIPKMIDLAEIRCARSANAVITVDELLAERYQTPGQPLHIIGHYPLKDLFSTPAPVFSHPEINLLYHGRLSRDRGLLFYVEVLKGLLALGIPARLHLAGVFAPAVEESSFNQAARDLGENIIFHGWIDYKELPRLFYECDIGLTLLQPEPRYLRATPVKLFEYMGAGLPVLGSDFPPLRKIIAETKAGALIDPTDIAAALDQIIAWQKQPGTARQVGANGFAAVQLKYNWESLSKDLVNLYNQLLI